MFVYKQKQSKSLWGLLVFAYIGFFVQWGYASEPKIIDERFVEFEAYVSESVAPGIPGAALVIVKDGKIQLIETYGVRRVGSQTPVTKETAFRLASVSKTFASAAIELLVQKNILQWNTPIQSLLKNIRFKNPNYGKQITVQNVLSQTTGLLPHAYTNLLEDNVPYDRIIAKLKDVDFVSRPGKSYTYQNVVFSLVGDIIALTTGQSYETFVTEQIFKPLGMKQASFGLFGLLNSGNYATPHIWKNEQWTPVQIAETYYRVAPAAGVNASISDMGQWLLAQLGHKPGVLSIQALNDLQRKIIQTTPAQAHYGENARLGDVYYGFGRSL